MSGDEQFQEVDADPQRPLWIGPNNQYLCGNQITIADYLGAGIITLGELIRCDFSKYPNVERWLNNIKKLPNWDKVNETFYRLRDALRDQPFKAI